MPSWHVQWQLDICRMSTAVVQSVAGLLVANIQNWYVPRSAHFGRSLIPITNSSGAVSSWTVSCQYSELICTEVSAYWKITGTSHNWYVPRSAHIGRSLVPITIDMYRGQRILEGHWYQSHIGRSLVPITYWKVTGTNHILEGHWYQSQTAAPVPLYRESIDINTHTFIYSYCYVYVFILTSMLCSVYCLPTGILQLPWLRFSVLFPQL